MHPPFAPPFLVDGKAVVGQTAAILLYLGPRLGLVAKNELQRLWAHQLQLTIADVVMEAHDTHHPIASDLYYEDQKKEALRRATASREERISKFFAWFDSVLARNPGGNTCLVGARLSYADLSLFQLVAGLHARVAQRPRVAGYLASERRIPFNEDGIFRRYPELDG